MSIQSLMLLRKLEDKQDRVQEFNQLKRWSMFMKSQEKSIQKLHYQTPAVVYKTIIFNLLIWLDSVKFTVDGQSLKTIKNQATMNRYN